MSAAANRMAAKVAESASKAVGAAGNAAKAGNNVGGGGTKGKETLLQKGAKRDPELYVWRHFSYGQDGTSLTDLLLDFTYHHDRRFCTCWLSLRYARHKSYPGNDTETLS